MHEVVVNDRNRENLLYSLTHALIHMLGENNVRIFLVWCLA
jgi:hypothetical protein